MQKGLVLQCCNSPSPMNIGGALQARKLLREIQGKCFNLLSPQPNSACLLFHRLRHRIISVSAPWVATQKTPYTQCEAVYRTMLLDSLHAINRTGGSKATRRRQQRRNKELVKTNGKYQHKYCPCAKVGKKLSNPILFQLRGVSCSISCL